MEDFATSQFKDKPLELLSWGIAYNPVPNQINMGLEGVNYPNDDTIYAVFAHEIGHSFDPCRFEAFLSKSGNNPFEKVISCLRSKKSVAAKKRDDSKMDKLVKSGKLSRQLQQALLSNPTCNKLQYPPIGIQSDQIGESFADWFSAEIIHMRDSVKKGLRADLCNVKILNQGSSYPNNLDRLQKIYLAHPSIRKGLELKTASQFIHCSL